MQKYFTSCDQSRVSYGLEKEDKPLKTLNSAHHIISSESFSLKINFSDNLSCFLLLSTLELRLAASNVNLMSSSTVALCLYDYGSPSPDQGQEVLRMSFEIYVVPCSCSAAVAGSRGQHCRVSR